MWFRCPCCARRKIPPQPAQADPATPRRRLTPIRRRECDELFGVAADVEGDKRLIRRHP